MGNGGVVARICRALPITGEAGTWQVGSGNNGIIS